MATRFTILLLSGRISIFYTPTHTYAPAMPFGEFRDLSIRRDRFVDSIVNVIRGVLA